MERLLKACICKAIAMTQIHVGVQYAISKILIDLNAKLIVAAIVILGAVNLIIL